jgi:hypothetical protein
MYKRLAPFNTIGNQTFFWRSTTDVSAIAQTALSDAAGTYNFQLGNCPGYADFAATFDMYRLRAAAIMFSPMITTNTSAATAVYLPRLFTCLDYDDANTVTRAQIQQYDTCVVSPPGSGIVRVLDPHMAVAAYAAGAFTSFANMENEWIDMASAAVQHYGVKYVVEGGATGQTVLQTYTITVTMFWEFKATR